MQIGGEKKIGVQICIDGNLLPAARAESEITHFWLAGFGCFEIKLMGLPQIKTILSRGGRQVLIQQESDFLFLHKA